MCTILYACSCACHPCLPQRLVAAGSPSRPAAAFLWHASVVLLQGAPMPLKEL